MGAFLLDDALRVRSGGISSPPELETALPEPDTKPDGCGGLFLPRFMWPRFSAERGHSETDGFGKASLRLLKCVARCFGWGSLRSGGDVFEDPSHMRTAWCAHRSCQRVGRDTSE